MLNIFLPKKTVTLDCFTNRADVYEYSKIDYSSNFIPKWWKQVPPKLSSSFFPSPTIKTCAGFTSLYKEGFIIPMWSDIAIKVDKEGDTGYMWQYSDKISEASGHSQEQRGTFMPEKEYVHLKLVNPWLIKSDKLIKFLWMQPSWNIDDFSTYHIPPGVIEYKFQHGANINLFVKRQKEEGTVNINFGQPLAHIVPLADVKIKLKHHLVSDEEIKRINQLHINLSFLNKYATMRKAK
jgi:hypothetical protein